MSQAPLPESLWSHEIAFFFDTEDEPPVPVSLILNFVAAVSDLIVERSGGPEFANVTVVEISSGTVLIKLARWVLAPGAVVALFGMFPDWFELLTSPDEPVAQTAAQVIVNGHGNNVLVISNEGVQRAEAHDMPLVVKSRETDSHGGNTNNGMRAGEANQAPEEVIEEPPPPVDPDARYLRDGEVFGGNYQLVWAERIWDGWYALPPSGGRLEDSYSRYRPTGDYSQRVQLRGVTFKDRKNALVLGRYVYKKGRVCGFVSIKPIHVVGSLSKRSGYPIYYSSNGVLTPWRPPVTLTEDERTAEIRDSAVHEIQIRRGHDGAWFAGSFHDPLPLIFERDGLKGMSEGGQGYVRGRYLYDAGRAELAFEVLPPYVLASR